MVLPARAAVPLIAHLLGAPVEIDNALFGVTYLSIVVAWVPLLAGLLQRTVAWPLAARLTAQVLLLMLTIVVVVLAVFLLYYAWHATPAFVLGDWLGALEPNIQTALLLYATAAGIVRAIQWYRSSQQIERERMALETAEAARARRLVHETLRPGTVAGILGRIGALLRSDPGEGERLVRRLARHCRRSLEVVRGSGTLTAATQLRGIAGALTLRGMTVALDADAAASAPASDALARFGEILEAAVRGADVAAAALSARRDGDALAILLRIEGRDADAVLDALRAAGTGAGDGEAALRIPAREEPPAHVPHAAVQLFGSLYLWLVVFVFLGAVSASQGGWIGQDLYGGGVPLLMGFLWPVVGPLLIWIVNRAVVLRRSLALPLIAVSVSGSGLLVTAVALEILYRINGPIVVEGMLLTRVDLIGRNLPYALTRNVLVACAVASVQFAFAAGRRHLRAEEEKERVAREIASQEFRELEATIHPHFLFNALTSLLALIRIDVARAAAMCSRLGALFTRTIASAGIQEWPLRRELEVVSDYLAVQQIRFGGRLSVSYAIDPAARAPIVPRLLLQPLVENAVRHGATHRAEPTEIRIEAVLLRGELRIRVCNDAPPCTRPPSFHEGLRFVTARVRAAGGTASIDSGGDRFTVTCLLPLRDRLGSR